MCTVSFIPRPEGFYLAMNRDESVDRVLALPPAEFRRAGLRCLYPHEPAGGTWIGANEAGLCLALMNGPAVGHAPTGEVSGVGSQPRCWWGGTSIAWPG